jgi:hypothetical protein
MKYPSCVIWAKQTSLTLFPATTLNAFRNKKVKFANLTHLQQCPALHVEANVGLDEPAYTA